MSKYLDAMNNVIHTSPLMAQYLSCKPDAADYILSGQFLNKLPSAKTLQSELLEILVGIDTIKDAAPLIGEFVYRKKFEGSVHLLENISPISKVNIFLANVAEAALLSLIPYTLKEAGKKFNGFEAGPFAFIAIGSLGAQQFSTQSDIDIIPVYRTWRKSAAARSEAHKFYKAVMEQISAALSQGSLCGRVYELDTKVKLDGKIASFIAEYDDLLSLANKGKPTWELINLSKSRVISTDTQFKQQVEEAIEKSLEQCFAKKSLKAIFLQNRNEIKKRYYKKDNIWNIKYAPGGIVDINIIIRYLILRNYSEGLNERNTILAVRKLLRYGVISKNQASQLAKSYKLLQKAACFLKLAGISEIKQIVGAEAMLDDMAPLILNKSSADSEMLENAIKKSLETCEKLFEEVFSH